MQDVTTAPALQGASQTDPVALMAARIREHVATDGRDAVTTRDELLILAADPKGNPRVAAAILFIAQEEALYGDRELASRCVRTVALSMVGNDPDLAQFAEFYVG